MGYLIVREIGGERNFRLVDAETTIGRSRQAILRLDTEQSSRVHCRLMQHDAGHKLVDAGSSNGTYVNGLKVTEKEMADGDVIAIGQAVLTYKRGDPPAPVPQPVAEHTTSPIPIHDRNVQILINTIISASGSTDIDAFLSEAVDNIVEIVQAERGILFMRDETNALKVRVARDQHRKPLPEVTGVSQSIPKQVFDTKKAAYLLDTEQEHETIQSKSVSIYHLRTVMCAPLRVGDKLLGVLYVDSHAKTREYTIVDLAIFEAITNYLALTEENVRAQAEAKKRDEQTRQTLERENVMLRQALKERSHLIGESAPMKAVYETLRKVAPTDATVLLLGASGTGKEALSRVIHDLSPRANKPFVVIDCAAIPESLLESELFGYEKGAFTGAVAGKTGKFELAQGGTLFLDEIGELSLGLQVKLLRALEQKTVTPVGGTTPVKIDARIVTATNRNLDDMVAKGTFRQDFYFRLKVVTVELPPLRERDNDVLLLADHFLREAAVANGRPAKGFSDDARGALLRHRWEGNIRELKHRIEQAVILSDREYLSTDDLELSGESSQVHTLEAARDAFEKALIVKTLARNDTNVTHTANALGISRQHLQNLIKKYAIRRGEAGDETELKDA